jgi:hypothetical protein
VTTPVVACLTGPNGIALSAPHRVDTAQRENAVVGIVGERSVNVRVTAEKLMALTVR